MKIILGRFEDCALPATPYDATAPPKARKNARRLFPVTSTSTYRGASQQIITQLMTRLIRLYTDSDFFVKPPACGGGLRFSGYRDCSCGIRGTSAFPPRS